MRAVHWLGCCAALLAAGARRSQRAHRHRDHPRWRAGRGGRSPRHGEQRRANLGPGRFSIGALIAAPDRIVALGFDADRKGPVVVTVAALRADRQLAEVRPARSWSRPGGRIDGDAPGGPIGRYGGAGGHARGDRLGAQDLGMSDLTANDMAAAQDQRLADMTSADLSRPPDLAFIDIAMCVDDGTACKGKQCGVAVNNCNVMVNCPDTCALPNTCGGAGVPNACGCTTTARHAWARTAVCSRTIA